MYISDVHVGVLTDVNKQYIAIDEKCSYESDR